MSALAYAPVAPEPFFAALALAHADLEERAKPLLDAREDIVFHADALCGVRLDNGNSADCYLRSALDGFLTARQRIDDALAELRCIVAADHNLWDGVDPDDVPLDSLERMLRRHRGSRRMA